MIIFLGSGAPGLAQDEVLLILESETAILQTGQEYEISFRLENAQDLWALEVEISFDPEMLYIMGTKAGSPMRHGAFFPSGQSVSIQNKVERRHIPYTLSMVAPSPPRQGDGIIGTFRVYPLQAGATRLEFRRAQLATVTTITDGNDTRFEVDSEPVAFIPILLDLIIEGDPVEPPDEATATPAPTATPTEVVSRTPVARSTAEPTLVNATLAPTVETPVSVDVTGETSPLIPIALVAIALGGGGLLILLMFYRRKQ